MPVDPDKGVHFPKNPQKFEFDEEVLQVFDDMAYRSILGYGEAHRFLTFFAQRFEFPKYCSVWDFGTTTGHALRSIKKGAGLHPGIKYCGLDCSQSSVEHATKAAPFAEIHLHDLDNGLLPSDFDQQMFPMAMGVFAYTLQFMDDQDQRDRLIQEAYDALTPGGALFVLEKYKLSDPLINDMAQDAYISIRKKNGYTLEEIYRKTEALRGAMWVNTPEYMGELLEAVGFETVHVVYRHWNFGGYLAIKGE